MNRLSRLKRALDTLYEARRDLYEKTGRLTQEELEFKPAPDRWSVGEVMDHIIKAESTFVRDLRKKILTFGEEPERDNLFSQILRPFIFTGMRHGSSLIKFEAQEEIRPVHGYPHLYLIFKLGQVRDATLDVAERLARREEPVYMHDPRVGAVYSGEDWLYLTGLHEMRHVGQVERIIAAMEEAKGRGELGHPRLNGTAHTAPKQVTSAREVAL